MEIRVLKYFLAVAREENISKAADSLHLTQPTLSRQLKELEDELGKKLLIRGSRKITLTQDGILLKKRAEEILSLVQKTKEELIDSTENISGNIFLGSGEFEGIRKVISTIQKIRNKYPNIHLHIISGDKEDILEKLDKGLIDFGIFISPNNISNYNHLKLPIKEQFGILMKKNDELAEKEYITIDDLKDKSIIISRQGLKDNIFSSNIDNLNIVGSYNLLYNASLMVQEGMGYAICLDNIINTTGRSNLVFKPIYPKITQEIYILWKKYQIFSKAGEKFLEQIKKDAIF